MRSEFEKWCLENDHDQYMLGLEDAYMAGCSSQQSKVDGLNQHIKRLESKLDSLGSDRQGLVGQVDELKKRLGELVKTLDQKADTSWKEWKSKAEMHEQGLANAYWEASELLEQALKGGGE